MKKTRMAQLRIVQVGLLLTLVMTLCIADDLIVSGDRMELEYLADGVETLHLQQGDDTGLSVDTSDKVDLAIAYHLATNTKPVEIEKYFVPFLISLLEKAKIDSGEVRVALVQYVAKAKTKFNLAKFKTFDKIREEISKIGRSDRGKKSAAGAALKEIRTKIFTPKGGDRPDSPNAVILITDDKNSDDQQGFLEEVETLKKAGVKIITVGIDGANANELQAAASDPASTYSIFTKSYTTVAAPEVIESVRSTIRALQDVRAPPAMPTRETQTEVTRPTYRFPYDLRRVDRADIVFAIHFSSTGSRQDFDTLKAFIQNIIDTADVDSGRVRFSFYVDGRGPAFDFSRYTRNEDIDNAVSRLNKNNFSAGKFGLTETLRRVGSEVFQPQAGNRDGVADALIVITDTNSGEDVQKIYDETAKLAQSGVQIYGIGVGLSDKKELENFATSVNNVFTFSDYEDLRQNGNSLRREIRAFNTKRPTVARPTPATRITPAAPDCALAIADLIIVIDTSTSVTEANFVKVRSFVRDFLRKTDIDSGNVRVGVVTYSDEVYQIFQLNTYRRLADVLYAVDNLPYNFGTTNTAEALDIMRDVMFTPVNGDRPDVPNYAIVLTDGVSNMGANQTIPSARKAHDEGIHIYSIGVGLSDYHELDGIASPPARENSFKVNNFDELENVDDIIFASACPKVFTMPPPTTTTTTRRTTTTTTQPTTTTTTRRTTTTTTRPTTTTTTRRPTTTTTRRPTTTTTRRPTTTTTRRTTTTTTRRPTTPRRIPQTSETGTDVIFMLDSSVDDRIFGWMKRFAKDFTSQLDVDSGKWRIGGMTFDSRSRADFHLNRYNFKDEIISSIDRLRNSRIGGRPDMADAFDYVRRNMFISNNGDRSKANNFVVLLTGNEKSANAERSIASANRLKDVGTGIFTIGLTFKDSPELDKISSEPLDDYRTYINSEDELAELPGIYSYRIERAPAPTARPVLRTTLAPRTDRPYIPYTGDCKAKGDVIFVLDTSGSVGENNFAIVKNFTFEVIKNLEIDNGFFRIGVISFSDTSRIEFQLNRYTSKDEIFNAIQRIPYVYGYTHTADALRRVRTEMFTTRNGDRPDVPNLLVIITDGQSNVNHEQTLPEARQIKSSGTTIVSVAIGVDDNHELRGMSSPPVEDNLIEVLDFDGLSRLSQVIISPLCSDTNLCDRNPCRNEGVCVDGLRSYICLCTAGFYGDNCEKACGPPADVVLILDSSTSVGSQNFNAIKGYAQNMVSEMNVETCNINVGVIKYSSAAMIQFNLGVYDTEDEIINGIQRISYTPGRANMADAIRVVRTQMFNNRNGDRPSARNIAFLFTDGSAEINRDITASEVELTVDAGVRLVPLGVNLRDRTEIEYIAETQGISFLEIEDDSNFQAMSDQVLEAVHDPNNHCSPNPCQNGAECVNQPLGFTCVCTEGFGGDRCDRACSNNADVVFVVDSSRYSSGPDFRTVKRFLRDVVKRIAFRGDNFRVAVVEYGASPRVRLPLSEGNDKRTVKSVIGALRRMGGDPNLESAIRLVSSNVLGEYGDRRDVPNYVVIVTRSVGGLPAVEAINELKSKGSKIIGFGIDLSASDRGYLEEAVTPPVEQTLSLVNSAADLETISVDFVNFVCQERNACANNPCQNGGICENGEKTYVCRCPSGYAGDDCSRRCEDKADVVFLIDSSGSVGFDNFRRIKEYVQHMIDSFNIGSESTQVGVATFSQSSRAEIYLNAYNDKRQLKAAVSGISYGYGNTNTASGIKLARSSMFSEAKGNRPDAPDYLIVITDGLSNINAEATLPEAEYARKQGIHIFAVGVGVADPWELNGIASQPSQNYVFQISSYEDLNDISDSLIGKTCRDPGVCDGDRCRNGGTCLAGIGTFTCQCQQGYVGQYCELGCQNNKDIVFILDASASVGPYNFELMLQYISAIVKNLTAYGQEHHFGLITYSTGVRTIFSLNRYSTVEQILEAIQTTAYTAGSTNTAAGLRQAIQLFQPEFGDRPTADNVAILMTDGQSNVRYWDTIPAAEDLKANNVKILAVGINLQTYDEVNAIATTQRDVYTVTSFKTLDQVQYDIIESSCSGLD